MDKFTIQYVFGRGSAREKVYSLELDPETLAVHWPEEPEIPAWAELDNHRCEGCPLAGTGARYCPVAVNLSVVAEDFRNDISYHLTTVDVSTPDRTYSKTVPVQQALFSLMGLIMATSECPHMAFLRPMARFHLPFANELETSVRSISMFLLRRYFEWRRDGESSFDLEELLSSYDHVERVNQGIAKRLRGIGQGDAGANAIVILHAFGEMLSFNIRKGLVDIEPLFSPLP